MSRAAGLVLRSFGSNELRHGSVHSPDELRLIISSAHTSGQLSSAQEEMLLNALELDNITARQVMVPRTRIFSLPADLSLENALSRVADEKHSRIPVYDPQRGPEHIVGVLYAKDLMRWMRLRFASNLVGPPIARISQMNVGQLMHDVLVVPETKSLFDLLVEFQLRKRHLAMVVDEFGSTAGVVSVEDVLEQLVGELKDEFDVAAPHPAVDANAPLILDGSINIRDLESQYDLLLPHEDGFETLAGFVLSRLQRMPEGGESFDYQGRRFTVEKMEGHRIALIRIEPVAAVAARAEPAQASAIQQGSVAGTSQQEASTHAPSAQKSASER
jgi:putative hemolysin